MFKLIIIAVVIAVVAILVYATTRPDNFRIERRIGIKAPPEKIAALIADFHQWTHWSPWEKLDPAMKRTFGGAPSGKGAEYAWDSAGKPGAGRMEILEASPMKTTIKLEFIRPFAAVHTAEFTMSPQGDTTTLNWAMFGTDPFIGKVMCLFFDRDKMVGGDFETGLASLKALAEK